MLRVWQLHYQDSCEAVVLLFNMLRRYVLLTHCTSRLLQRTTSSATAELSPEILALMEFTRQQMQSRKPKQKLVAAPNLR
jgi:hypothetical protein